VVAPVAGTPGKLDGPLQMGQVGCRQFGRRHGRSVRRTHCATSGTSIPRVG
jgi:hypothetical protein